MVYEIILTEQCNWKCYYCSVPFIKNPKSFKIDKQTESILSLLKTKINFKYDDLLLEGGEIGLLAEEKLNYIFQFFNKFKLLINTNGEFFKKDYHNIFKKNIKEIYYHVVEDPKHIETIKSIKTDIPINYGVVGEPQYLFDFIKHNKNIFFGYVGIETNNSDFSYTPYLNLFKQMLLLPNVNKFWINKLIYYSTCVDSNYLRKVREKCNSRDFLKKSFVYNLVRKYPVKCESKCTTVKLHEKCNKCNTCSRVCLSILED